MPDTDISGTLDESLAKLNELFRVTTTPEQRLFAFYALRTTATQAFADQLKAGEIDVTAAQWWLQRLRKL